MVLLKKYVGTGDVAARLKISTTETSLIFEDGYYKHKYKPDTFWNKLPK